MLQLYLCSKPKNKKADTQMMMSRFIRHLLPMKCWLQPTFPHGQTTQHRQRTATFLVWGNRWNQLWSRLVFSKVYVSNVKNSIKLQPECFLKQWKGERQTIQGEIWTARRLVEPTEGAKPRRRGEEQTSPCEQSRLFSRQWSVDPLSF